MGSLDNEHKFNILRFRLRISCLDNDRITTKVYVWSKSLVGSNWAWKIKKLLESIGDFGGLLSLDELWNELANLELKLWKNSSVTPEVVSGFTEKLNPAPPLNNMYS